MSVSTRLEETNQTTVILVEDDCVAVQVFYGDPRNENPEQPDAVMIYDAEALTRLVTALLQARIDLTDESWREYCRVLTEGFGCEAP